MFQAPELRKQGLQQADAQGGRGLGFEGFVFRIHKSQILDWHGGNAGGTSFTSRVLLASVVPLHYFP